MNLGELIEILDNHPRLDDVASAGFSKPHSYRGYYECLAFEPTWNVTVRSMLDAARSALGAEYEGWKGGEYVMRADTSVYIASEGCTNPNDAELTASEVLTWLHDARPAEPNPDAALVDETEHAYARRVTVELYQLDVLRRIDRHTEDMIRIALRRAKGLT